MSNRECEKRERHTAEESRGKSGEGEASGNLGEQMEEREAEWLPVVAIDREQAILSLFEKGASSKDGLAIPFEARMHSHEAVHGEREEEDHPGDEPGMVPEWVLRGVVGFHGASLLSDRTSLK